MTEPQKNTERTGDLRSHNSQYTEYTHKQGYSPDDEDYHK